MVVVGYPWKVGHDREVQEVGHPRPKWSVGQTPWHTVDSVFFLVCAFRDPEAKAIVNEIIDEVTTKRGVKRTMEDVMGDEMYSKYVESLRVPSYFKMTSRSSGHTWQAISNVTKLGWAGVRLWEMLLDPKPKIYWDHILHVSMFFCFLGGRGWEGA